MSFLLKLNGCHYIWCMTDAAAQIYTRNNRMLLSLLAVEVNRMLVALLAVSMNRAHTSVVTSEALI